MLQENATCRTLCREQVPAEDAKFVNDRIREDYALNWLVDGLPAAEMKMDVKTGDLFYDMGFNLGNDEDEFIETPALNNHYDVLLKSACIAISPNVVLISLSRYHEPRPGVYRIVGVLVWPSRCVRTLRIGVCLMSGSQGGDQTTDFDCDTNAESAALVLSENTANTVRYTYRITWSVRQCVILFDRC